MMEEQRMQDHIALLKERMRQLFWRIAEAKEQISIDGVPGFSERAQFVNGKVINFCSYIALEVLEDTEERSTALDALRDVIRFASELKMETWGILNTLKGLYRLARYGLLDSVVDSDMLEQMKQTLDWRTFVDEHAHFQLIHKPANYYGVAFGIARYRELLGWEPVKYSEILLSRLMEHISRYSGSYGYMDETAGQGRFDRYSLLIPAEITGLVLSIGWEEPELIRSMLSHSAHLVLQFANTQGTGFAYGRSIGAYGDTAVLQILSTAAAMGGILTERETSIAYGYCCRILKRMNDFWYDEDMKSFNLWEKGRRTDGYRNKNRILGENISLFMQMNGAIRQWLRCGYTWNQEPEVWEDMLSDLPPCSVTMFADQPLPRGLIVVRDGGTVWQLPVISGGNEYADRDPYLPVPRSSLTLEAVPDVVHSAWLPQLELKDGSRLIPAAYIDSMQIDTTENETRVTLHQQGFIVVGQRVLTHVPGVEAHTVYSFQRGRVIREDEIHLSPAVQEMASCLRLVCDVQHGCVCAEGYETKIRQSYQQVGSSGYILDTPHGACREVITYENHTLQDAGILTAKWDFRY